jgi:hypothetical protein
VGKALPITFAVAVGIAGLAAVWYPGLSANPGPLGFRLDDAWIQLIYGRGLLENGYLAYNEGIPSTGCTSPLWAIVLAALHGLLGDGASPDRIVGAVVLTGAVLHLAGVAVATDLTHRVTRSNFAAVAAGGLVALATPLAAASFSGMEVALTGTLLLLGVRGLVSRAWLQGGTALALAGLARP